MLPSRTINLASYASTRWICPMNRRGFLGGLGAMVAGIALERAIPFGRVWSFPKVIKRVPSVSYDTGLIENFKANTPFLMAANHRYLPGRHYDLMIMDDLVGEQRCDNHDLTRIHFSYVHAYTYPDLVV